MEEKFIEIKTYGWESLSAEYDEFGSVNIRFSASKAFAINVSSRAKDATFRVRACLKRYKPEILFEDNIIFATYSSCSCVSRAHLLQELYHIIDEIAFAPLTPKMVCEALGIKAAERTRLVRCGVLKSSGQSNFPSDERSGYFSLYSAHSVRQILLSDNASFSN